MIQKNNNNFYNLSLFYIIINVLARICSKHFSPNAMQTKLNCFNYSPIKKRKLKLNATPTKNLTHRKVSIFNWIG